MLMTERGVMANRQGSKLRLSLVLVGQFAEPQTALGCVMKLEDIQDHREVWVSISCIYKLRM